LLLLGVGSVVVVDVQLIDPSLLLLLRIYLLVMALKLKFSFLLNAKKHEWQDGA